MDPEQFSKIDDGLRQALLKSERYLEGMKVKDLEELLAAASAFVESPLGRLFMQYQERTAKILDGLILKPPVDPGFVTLREQLIGERRQLQGILEFFEKTVKTLVDNERVAREV